MYFLQKIENDHQNHVVSQGVLNSQDNPEKEDKAGGLTSPDFKHVTKLLKSKQ
jgi:hypothetical protein